MKLIITNKLFITCVCVSAAIPLNTRAQHDSTAKPQRQSLIYLQYHVKNNQIPYLFVQTKNKVENGFFPAPDVPVTIYMDQDSSKEALVGEVVTNQKGEGSIVLPASLSSKWAHPGHTFYASTKSSKDFDATSKSVSMTLSKLELDTVVGAEARTVAAKLLKKEGDAWIPMGEVDVKIGVKRLGGYLSVGDKEAYTTDSTGKAEAEFQQVNLPGDSAGRLQIVALVDDNDEVGTVENSINVPWGAPTIFKSNFGERSLWATPRRAPIWLMFMAYGCIIAVWSVILYLVTRIRIIRKLGRQEASA